MAHSVSQAVTTAPLEVERDVRRRATCPLCHTAHPSLTDDALRTGLGWQCVRCSQHWDAKRLATVAAYDAWVVELAHARLGSHA